MKYATLALLLMAFTTISHADPFQFSLNPFPEIIELGKNLPPPKLVGTLQLANGSLPAYQVYFNTVNYDKPYTVTPPTEFKVAEKLEKKWQKELVAYSFNGFDERWMIVPKNWKFINAGEWGNGTVSITFAPSNGEKGHFTYWSNGYCSPCAVEMASVFFKEADNLYKKQYGSRYHHTQPAMTAKQISPYTQAYRTTIDGQNIDGLVTYFGATNDEGSSAERIEVSLPKSQAHLATPILNWWIK